MPFDGTQTAPSLRLLSEILRDQKRWPEGFEWDYGNCDQCAMGLAARLWKTSGVWPNSYSMAHLLNIPRGVSKKIFVNLATFSLYSTNTVTPERVADAIDAFLAKRERGQNTQ